MCYYKTALLAVALCALLGLSCGEQASPVPERAAVVADTSLVIKVYSVGDRGFGYSIWQGDRQVIKQPNIPAVQHNLPFRSRKEAEITANLMKQKLQAHQFPPTITIRELDSLSIHY